MRPPLLVLAGVLLLALTPAPSRAQDEQTVDGWMILSLGLQDPLQPGLRRWLETERDFVAGSIPTDDWKDRFPPLVAPRIEFAARVGHGSALGISAETFRGVVENGGQNPAVPYNEWEVRIRQQLVEYALHATVWPSRWKGRYLGGSIGLGRGTQRVDGSGVLTSDPNQRVNVNGTWKSSIKTYSAYAGWQARYRDNPGLDVRVGWAFRDFGQVRGGAWSSPAGPATGPLTDFEGRPVDVDYSGPFITLGFVFRPTPPEE